MFFRAKALTAFTARNGLIFFFFAMIQLFAAGARQACLAPLKLCNNREQASGVLRLD